MTIDPDEPAFPRTYSHDGHNGITIRAHFASLALQGLLSDTSTLASLKDIAPQGSEADFIAQAALNFADALITELNKKKEVTNE